MNVDKRYQCEDIYESEWRWWLWWYIYRKWERKIMSGEICYL